MWLWATQKPELIGGVILKGRTDTDEYFQANLLKANVYKLLIITVIPWVGSFIRYLIRSVFSETTSKEAMMIKECGEANTL